MLRDMFSKNLVKSNSHLKSVHIFKDEVGEKDYYEIADWWVSQFETKEWVGTSWEAPEDWSGTPLDVIWKYMDKIPDMDERHRQSAIMYGRICYSILYEQPELYEFYRPEGHHKDDPRPFGLVYRKVTD